ARLRETGAVGGSAEPIGASPIPTFRARLTRATAATHDGRSGAGTISNRFAHGRVLSSTVFAASETQMNVRRAASGSRRGAGQTSPLGLQQRRSLAHLA